MINFTKIRKNIGNIRGLIVTGFVTGLAILSSLESFARPIDWSGRFGVSSATIDTYRKTSSFNSTRQATSGSQELLDTEGASKTASIQSFVFRLAPNVIINDALSLKAEFSSGVTRGGFLGENSGTGKNPSAAHALYHFNSNNSQSSALIVEKAYMELYSDPALYQIGRHSFDWGLGAIYNSGKDIWDHYSFVRDGLTINLQLGNFYLAPFLGKIGQSTAFLSSSRGEELGVAALYDNKDKEMSVGILYSIKSTEQMNTTYKSSMGGTEKTLGKSEVKVTDIYLSKTFGPFRFAVEVPFLSGNLKNVYGTEETTSFQAKAFLFETEFKLGTRWSVQADFGMIDGQKAETGNKFSSFSALYLNPNYQKAKILYRYNLSAVADAKNQNIFDSYMTNSQYVKLSTRYKGESWIFNGGVFWAKAKEAAEKNKLSYHHEQHKQFTALYDQDKDLGLELNADITFKWNEEFSVMASGAYLFVGDYFTYTNTTEDLSTKNSYLLELKASLSF